MNEDILVSTVRDILKVHISPHGLDFIQMTLPHGFISDPRPLWPECTCHTLSPTLNNILQLQLVWGELPVSNPTVNLSTGDTLYQGYTW